MGEMKKHSRSNPEVLLMAGPSGGTSARRLALRRMAIHRVGSYREFTPEPVHTADLSYGAGQ
jgi:hypothetical protein